MKVKRCIPIASRYTSRYDLWNWVKPAAAGAGSAARVTKYIMAHTADRNQNPPKNIFILIVISFLGLNRMRSPSPLVQ